MAAFTAEVRTKRSVDEVFAYMADLRNFAAWDPSVSRSVQVEGAGGGGDALFDVTVDGPLGQAVTLRYRTMDFDPPSKLTVRAETKALTSLDRVRVSSDGDHTVVVYEAELHLNGWRAIAGPFLGRLFHGIGERAAEGLARVLDGELVR